MTQEEIQAKVLELTGKTIEDIGPVEIMENNIMPISTGDVDIFDVFFGTVVVEEEGDSNYSIHIEGLNDVGDAEVFIDNVNGKLLPGSGITKESAITKISAAGANGTTLKFNGIKYGFRKFPQIEMGTEVEFSGMGLRGTISAVSDSYPFTYMMDFTYGNTTLQLSGIPESELKLIN